MINPLTANIAPRIGHGDTGLARLAALSTDGPRPLTATAARTAAPGGVGKGAAVSGRLAQSVGNGGSAFGKGNFRFDSVPGGLVGTTAAHVLIHQGFRTAVPTQINVDGSDTRTSIKRFFPDPKAVKFYSVVGTGGQGIDVVKFGESANIKAHFEKLAKAQPTVDDMKGALAKPQAKWQIETASEPQSYAPNATAIEPPRSQANWSETTPKFSFGLTALPLQVKDLAADLKASGLGSFAGKPDSWLALGAIGGDENNRSSPYKGLILVNRGVSGSESNPSGVSSADKGTLTEGMDVRSVAGDKGWTRANVGALVERSAPLRAALKTKFPDLTTSQAAEKLYLQGFVKIAFITKDIAVSNLEAINRASR